MTWRATSRRVKGLSRTTSVIMMARSADEEDVRLALNAGAYVVLDRPLAREQVGRPDLFPKRRAAGCGPRLGFGRAPG